MTGESKEIGGLFERDDLSALAGAFLENPENPDMMQIFLRACTGRYKPLEQPPAKE